MRIPAMETSTGDGLCNSRTGLPEARRRRGAWAWLADRLARARERRTAETLLALDDYLLDDIGLSRAEAEWLVRTGRLFDERC